MEWMSVLGTMLLPAGASRRPECKIESSPYHLPGRGVRGGTGRPACESETSCPNRFARVSGFFALTTHHVAALRYDGGRDEKYAHACASASSSFPSASDSLGSSRCS